MATHRHTPQVAQVVNWLAHTRASTGRYQPTLPGGRDGIFVPLRPQGWQAGATATVSGLDRRGTRLGTVSLGRMPEPGQETWTVPCNAVLRDLLSHVESPGRRWVSVTDAGSPPSDYSPSVVQQMPDPRRPWRHLEWRRMIDASHACQYGQQLADVICGPGSESQRWAQPMREQGKTRANGVARVFQSAAALRHQRGLSGQATVSARASASLKKRRPWMREQSYRRQHGPIGSGITEAACKVVCTQRLTCSGMSWTIDGGQVILALRVIRVSGVWEDVHQRDVVAKPLPVPQGDMARGTQGGQQAA